MPPSAVDAACVSAAHSEEDVQITIDVCKQALQSIY
jgi:glutamate-1-semialdehyde aminotransferase